MINVNDLVIKCCIRFEEFSPNQAPPLLRQNTDDLHNKLRPWCNWPSLCASSLLREHRAVHAPRLLLFPTSGPNQRTAFREDSHVCVLLCLMVVAKAHFVIKTTSSANVFLLGIILYEGTLCYQDRIIC